MSTKKENVTKDDINNSISSMERRIADLTARLEARAAAQEVEAALEVKAEAAPEPKPEPAKKSPRGSLPKGMAAPKPEAAPEPKPEPKPEPAKKSPRGSLPKGMGTAKPESKPAPPPKAAPANIAESLEIAYNNSAMTSFHDYRAKVTGYAPAPNRYFVRRTAPTGRVPTEPSWNDQKAKVTGYTQPSNQYFATRARLAYHPPDKTFGGYNLQDNSGKAKQTQAPPPPQQTQAPPPPPPQQTQNRKDDLAEYEKEYLSRLEKKNAERQSSTTNTQQDVVQAQEAARIAQQKADAAVRQAQEAARIAQQKADAAASQAQSTQAKKPTRGTLPKGF